MIEKQDNLILLKKYVDSKFDNLESEIESKIQLASDSILKLSYSIDKMTSSIDKITNSLDATILILKNSVPMKIVVLIILAIVLGKNAESFGHLVLGIFGK